jgi:hypothetical protein
VSGWIFEGLTLPKDDLAPDACEDRVVMLPPDFAAVIDGATDISGKRHGGRSGGALAAEAIAAAFADAWTARRQGGPDPFATVAEALALADRAIAALYVRLGLAEPAKEPASRFRAAFAVASLKDGIWRGVGVGDCALRVNESAPVLREHPAEAVLAAWRAAMIAADPLVPEAGIRAALVGGASSAEPSARRYADGLAEAETELGRIALSAGIAGMRAARPGTPLAFGVADGVGDMGLGFGWQLRAPETDVEALALWSDGWLSAGGRSIGEWLAAAKAAHAADPRRVGRYRCVKGPGASGRHDDMGLVLIRRA